MKILLVNYDDYANFAYHQCESLKRIGLDAECVKVIKHAFSYEKEADVIPLEAIYKKMAEADVIFIMHSAMMFVETAKKLNKRTIVWHTGSHYRANPHGYNAVFNAFVDMTFTDQCEFMQLGAKKIHYIAATLDAKAYKSSRSEVKKPYTIAHFPSNADVKGTDKIRQMISGIDQSLFRLNISTDKVNHEQQLKRMSECDIYIELFKPELRGKPYGCFGVTAFEAAAAGKVVVTQNIHKEVYAQAYGSCALILANTEEEFDTHVRALITCPEQIIELKQKETLEWIMKNHNYEANALRIKSILRL